ncbi:MAG: hypothetical protein K2G27_07065 [Duncaniella sp.]|nr:hypothetical protein [Duncaniella sp.]
MFKRGCRTHCYRERQTERDESERGIRLNIFGMIDRNNRYEGFSTTENMTAERIADFLDRVSMRIGKNTFLNISETLWRILKGKWLRPVDYFSTDSLLYATNRALAAIGSELNINFAHAV